MQSTHSRINTDEIPLGELFPSAITNGGLHREIVIDEPPQYETCPPPSYAQVQKNYLTKNHLRRFCAFFIDIDFVMNSIMILMSIAIHCYVKEFNWSIMIPIAYLFVSGLGRIGLSQNKPEWLIIYCGSYFGRWFGDAAVLIYSLSINYQQMYEMRAYSLYTTILMVGIRGFYPDLFPCYSATIKNDSCPKFLENAEDTKYHYVLYWMVI